MVDDNTIQQQKNKVRPQNTVDLQVMTIEPYISSEYISDRLRNKFRNYVYILDEKGNIALDEDGNPKIRLVRDMWATIEIFTQDQRLGNLKNSEVNAITYNLDLCSDILTVLPESFNKPAFILLERATSTLEVSSSRGGFVRTLFNTMFQNQSYSEDKPQKRSFFGKFGKGDN